jgi:hypothetical protein
MRVVKMPGYISVVEAYRDLTPEESVRVRPHSKFKGVHNVKKVDCEMEISKVLQTESMPGLHLS